MKIPADKMKPILRSSIQFIHYIFTEHNYKFRVVGGAVRDLLMNKVPSDIDFATTATPREMKSLFYTNGIKTIHPKGETHGTITANIGGINFECTTLHMDELIDRTRTKMKFAHDFEEDASRRDLTINAMYLDFDGTVYDYFNGIQHLEERKIKFVGDPDKKIQSNSSRILRYFRFFGMLTDDPHNHDPEAIESIISNRDLLSKVPPQIVGPELSKILMGKYNLEILLKMIDCGLGEHIGLPSDFDCENVMKIYKNIEGTNHHHFLLLAAGMKNEEELIPLFKRVTMSKRDRYILHFIIKNRNLFCNIQTVNDIKDYLVDFPYKEVGTSEKELLLELSKQLLIYSGRSDLLGELNNYLLPNLSSEKKIVF